MTARPYIGVTGIVTPAEAGQFDYLAGPLVANPEATHRLMAGVLVSGRTMAGEQVPSRRYPPVSSLREITDKLARKSFATVHFNTRVDEPLDEQVLRILDLAPATQGVQLNMVLPDRAGIERLKAAAPGLEIILQMNGSSLRRVAQALGMKRKRPDPTPCPVCTEWRMRQFLAGKESLTPEALSASILHYLKIYAGVVDHALVDLSGGRGTSINVDSVVGAFPEWIEAARSFGITLGVAGGLGPDSANVLEEMTARLPASVRTVWSIDSESRVRKVAPNPIAGEDAQDDLDIHAVARYVRMASEVFVKASLGTAMGARATVEAATQEQKSQDSAESSATAGCKRPSAMKR